MIKPFNKRVPFALVVFGLAGLIGPMLHLFGVSYDLTSPLWPTWILGVYEETVGRAIASTLTVSSNVILFMLIGTVCAFPNSRTSYLCVSLAVLIVLYLAAPWRYGDQIGSYVILALFLIALFTIYGVTVRLLATNLSNSSI